MDILRLVSLLSDIVFNDTPIASFSDSSSIVAVTPEFPAPEFFFQCWVMRKEFSGGDTFVESDDLANAVFGMEREEKVNMILIGTELLHFQFIAFGESPSRFFEGVYYQVVEERFAILYGEDDMIVSLVGTMVAFFEGVHDSSRIP